MRTIEWRDVGQDSIRLRAENSKNKKQRVLPLRGELAEIIERARQNRRLDCQFVFHVDGQPIGDFRKAWHNACVAAGPGKFEKIGEEEDAKKVYVGLLIHDLRRSAVRNMVRAGIPEMHTRDNANHSLKSLVRQGTIHPHSRTGRRTIASYCKVSLNALLNSADNSVKRKISLTRSARFGSS